MQCNIQKFSYKEEGETSIRGLSCRGGGEGLYRFNNEEMAEGFKGATLVVGCCQSFMELLITSSEESLFLK